MAALARGGALELVTPADVLIASTPHRHEYEGKTLEDLCRLTGKPVEEAVKDILTQEGEGVVAVIFGMDEADVRRVLGTYARAEKLFSIEEAVFRMAELPAQKFHLTDRGAILEGAYADVVVFDPRAVGNRDLPGTASLSVGHRLCDREWQGHR